MQSIVIAVFSKAVEVCEETIGSFALTLNSPVEFDSLEDYIVFLEVLVEFVFNYDIFRRIIRGKFK